MFGIRRLGSGDEEVVRGLATKGDPARLGELLADERTIFLVAFEGDQPVAFLLAHELIRRHGEPSNLLVYEVDVDPEHRRRGIATALFEALRAHARAQGIRSAFLITDEANAAAMALYRAVGGIRPNVDDVIWEFTFD